jgi:hypothetical protein
VTKNLLLTHQFTDHQQLVVPMPSCRQKGATAGDQGINTSQIPFQMAQLLSNGLADLGNARSLLLRHGEKLLPGFLAMCSRLIAKGCSDLRMHRINQLLRDLPGLIEQREIRWISDVDWDARGVNQKGALVGRCFV